MSLQVYPSGYQRVKVWRRHFGRGWKPCLCTVPAKRERASERERMGVGERERIRYCVVCEEDSPNV